MKISSRKSEPKFGRPIKVDGTTSLISKGKFARIYIEVDITKRLLSKFELEGKKHPIEYEGIHLALAVESLDIAKNCAVRLLRIQTL